MTEMTHITDPRLLDEISDAVESVRSFGDWAVIPTDTVSHLIDAAVSALSFHTAGEDGLSEMIRTGDDELASGRIVRNLTREHVTALATAVNVLRMFDVDRAAEAIGEIRAWYGELDLAEAFRVIGNPRGIADLVS